MLQSLNEKQIRRLESNIDNEVIIEEKSNRNYEGLKRSSEQLKIVTEKQKEMK